MQTSVRAVSVPFAFLSPKAPGTRQAHPRASVSIYSLAAEDGGKWRGERRPCSSRGWVSLWAEQLPGLPHGDASWEGREAAQLAASLLLFG